MNWKPIHAAYDSVCRECRTTILKNNDAYWRRDKGVLCPSCYARYGVNDDALSSVNTTTTQCVNNDATLTRIDYTTTQRDATQRNDATTPTPLMPPSRESAIATAHAENMEANERLVIAIDALSANVQDVRIALDKVAKWLLDAALNSGGLKL